MTPRHNRRHNDPIHGIQQLPRWAIITVWIVCVVTSWLMILAAFGLISSCTAMSSCNPSLSATPARAADGSISLDRMQAGVKCQF